MTQLEILELALIGAETNLKIAASKFGSFVIVPSQKESAIEQIRKCIHDRDEIVTIIEQCKKGEGVPAATDTPDLKNHSCEF